MSFLEKFLHSLEGEMTRPGNYGWFHLVSVFVIITLTVFLCLKFRDADEKVVRRILFIAWIVMMFAETLKQVLFTFEYDGVSAVWDYQWYAFPYQLCGTPLVVLPFIVFLKEGKVRDAFMAFMSTFSLFGGLATFFYPNDVFVREIAINIQTMLHHGLQIVLGVFIAVHNRRRLTHKYYLSSIPVFAGLLGLAMAMNIGVYHIFVAKGIDETFNMFYVSPYFDCTLPVLSSIYPKVPYAIFIVLYIFGFVLISAILHYGTKWIINLTSKKTSYVEE